MALRKKTHQENPAVPTLPGVQGRMRYPKSSKTFDMVASCLPSRSPEPGRACVCTHTLTPNQRIAVGGLRDTRAFPALPSSKIVHSETAVRWGSIATGARSAELHTYLHRTPSLACILWYGVETIIVMHVNGRGPLRPLRVHCVIKKEGDNGSPVSDLHASPLFWRPDGS